MSPIGFLITIGAGVVAGGILIGAIYEKGARSCAPAWQLKVANAQAKNRELAPAYYKAAAEAAKQLATDADAETEKQRAKYENLLKGIDALSNSTPICVPADFLRDLEGIRQLPPSKTS